eukprot:g991.t1
MERKFFSAIKKGDAVLMREILKREPHLYERADKKGRTPLHWAAFCGHCKIIEELVVLGANVDALTSAGESPLSLCAEANKIETAKTLIRLKCNYDIEARGGLSCLHIAAKYNSAVFAKGRSPAFLAASFCNIETFQILVKSNEKESTLYNDQDCDGNTYIHAALSCSNKEALAQFLEMTNLGCSPPNTVERIKVFDSSLAGDGRVFLGYKEISSSSEKSDKFANIMYYEPPYLRLNRAGLSAFHVAEKLAKDEEEQWLEDLKKEKYNERLKLIEQGCGRPANTVLRFLQSKVMPKRQKPPATAEQLAARKIATIREFLVSLRALYGKTKKEMEKLATDWENDPILETKFHNNRTIPANELEPEKDDFTEADAEKLGLVFRVLQDLQKQIREDGRRRRAMDQYKRDGIAADSDLVFRKATREENIAAADKWVKTWDPIWNRVVFQNFITGACSWEFPGSAKLAAGVGNELLDNTNALIDLLEKLDLMDHKFTLSQNGIKVCTDLTTISAEKLGMIIATKLKLPAIKALPLMEEADRMRSFNPGYWIEKFDDTSHYYQHSKTNEIKEEITLSSHGVLVVEDWTLQHRHEKRLFKRLVDVKMNELRAWTRVQRMYRGVVARRIARILSEKRAARRKEEARLLRLRESRLTVGSTVTVNYNREGKWLSGRISKVTEYINGVDVVGEALERAKKEAELRGRAADAAAAAAFAALEAASFANELVDIEEREEEEIREKEEITFKDILLAIKDTPVKEGEDVLIKDVPSTTTENIPLAVKDDSVKQGEDVLMKDVPSTAIENIPLAVKDVSVKQGEDIVSTSKQAPTEDVITYTYDIIYDDGDEEKNITLPHLLHLKPSDRVLANFKGENRWYKALITDVQIDDNGFARYDVMYKDEEIETVGLDHIRYEEWDDTDDDEEAPTEGKGIWIEMEETQDDHDGGTSRRTRFKAAALAAKAAAVAEKLLKEKAELRLKKRESLKKKKVVSKKRKLKKKKKDPIVAERERQEKLIKQEQERKRKDKIKRLKVGTSILGNYGGEGEWFRGEILAINPDGTYVIAYDDGDDEGDVPLDCIKLDPNYIDSDDEDFFSDSGDDEGKDKSKGKMFDYVQEFKIETKRLRKLLKRKLKQKDKVRAMENVWKKTLRSGMRVQAKVDGKWLSGEIIDTSDAGFDIAFDNEEEREGVSLDEIRFTKEAKQDMREKIERKKFKKKKKKKKQKIIKKKIRVAAKDDPVEAKGKMEEVTKVKPLVKKKKRKVVGGDDLLPFNKPVNKEAELSTSTIDSKTPIALPTRKKKKKKIKAKKKIKRCTEEPTSETKIETKTEAPKVKYVSVEEAWEQELERRRLLEEKEKKKIEKEQRRIEKLEAKRKAEEREKAKVAARIKAKEDKIRAHLAKREKRTKRPKSPPPLTPKEKLLMSLGYSKKLSSEALAATNEDAEEAALYLQSIYPDPPALRHQFEKKARFVNAASTRRWRYEQQRKWEKQYDRKDTEIVLAAAIGSASVENVPLVTLAKIGQPGVFASLRRAGRRAAEKAIAKVEKERWIRDTEKRERRQREGSRLRKEFWIRHHQTADELNDEFSDGARKRLQRYRKLYQKEFQLYEPLFGTPVLLWTLSAIHHGSSIANGNETKYSSSKRVFGKTSIQATLESYRVALEKEGVLLEFKLWKKKKQKQNKLKYEMNMMKKKDNQYRQKNAEKFMLELDPDDKRLLTNSFPNLLKKYDEALGASLIYQTIVQSNCDETKAIQNLERLISNLPVPVAPTQVSQFQLLKRKRRVPVPKRTRRGIFGSQFRGFGKLREKNQVPLPPSRLQK